MSVRAREQIGNIIRDSTKSFNNKTGANLDVETAYYGRGSADSNQSQMSTVTLDSFDDSDEEESQDFIRKAASNPQPTFIKASKREIKREDINLVHNKELVEKADTKEYAPIHFVRNK